MIKKIIAVLLAVILLSGGILIMAGNKLFFPSYEMTESIAFAQSLGSGWNLANTFDACEKFSTEKAGLEAEKAAVNVK